MINFIKNYFFCVWFLGIGKSNGKGKTLLKIPKDFQLTPEDLEDQTENESDFVILAVKN